jgi:N-acetylneuraminate synthase
MKIIAEIGINHNGSLDLAKELIDAAAAAGCTAVKFQKRTVDDVYSPEELALPRKSPFGTTTREQKEGLEFSMEEYKILESYAKDHSLEFIISCWDLNSITEVENNLNVDYHKVASALVTDRSFLEALNTTGKPIILSTGMSTFGEIDKAVSILNNLVYILSCTSTYPTNSCDVNLSYITTLKHLYPHIKVGFSNHYNGHDACVGAAVLGAECIEFHITKDRTMYGSDQSASIEMVGPMVTKIKNAQELTGDGKKVVFPEELEVLKKLRKVNDT